MADVSQPTNPSPSDAPVSDETPAEPARFVELARSLGFLSADGAGTLLTEASRRGFPPSLFAVQSGALSLSQADVVETLLRPGERIPGYEVLDFVGQGGMGVVYRARQKALKRIVALKTVLVSQLASPSAAARFEQEALTVARLQHPHIVAAYDFGRHDGRLYFAMEFVEGEDVERLIERSGPLDESTAWGLARQAASGLAHAAALGVVHRDIKPANLLLVEPPAGFPLPVGLPLVKIADFGLALLSAEADARTRLTGLNTALGSPHYMAPEQVDQSEVDHRADVYALGATVYHMLAGVPPFAGGSLTKILSDKMNRGPRPLREIVPHLAPEVVLLVDEMMARSAADRPADYQRLIARIDALPIHRTVSARGGVTVELPRSDVGDAARRSAPPRPTNPTPSHLASLPTQPFAAVRPEAIAGRPDDTHPEGVGSTSEPVRAPVVRRAPSWKLVVAMAAGISLIALLSSLLVGRNRARPEPLVPTSGEHLFDGVTLRGWLPSGGAWTVAKDEGGAGVISGSDGALWRSFRDRNVESGRATLFRITLVVQPRQAKTVDVLFADGGGSARGPQGLVRFADGRAVAGTQRGDKGPFRALGQGQTLAASAPAHEVKIERHLDRWWIWVDDRLLGGVPRPSGADQSAIGLRVEGEAAWFSDLLLEELAPIDRPDPRGA